MTDDDPAGLPPAFVAKIINILSFLQDAPSTAALQTIQSWRAHQLTGDRKGTWSLTVSRNWRITFGIESGEIIDLDFEDYH